MPVLATAVCIVCAPPLVVAVIKICFPFVLPESFVFAKVAISRKNLNLEHVRAACGRRGPLCIVIRRIYLLQNLPRRSAGRNPRARGSSGACGTRGACWTRRPGQKQIPGAISSRPVCGRNVNRDGRRRNSRDLTLHPLRYVRLRRDLDKRPGKPTEIRRITAESERQRPRPDSVRCVAGRDQGRSRAGRAGCSCLPGWPNRPPRSRARSCSRASAGIGRNGRRGAGKALGADGQGRRKAPDPAEFVSGSRRVELCVDYGSAVLLGGIAGEGERRAYREFKECRTCHSGEEVARIAVRGALFLKIKRDPISKQLASCFVICPGCVNRIREGP